MQKKLNYDVVMQATGRHAHGVSHGIVNALKKIDRLGNVFNPKANWGDLEPHFDDGLFNYLDNPKSHGMIILGYDWHSQALHSTEKWRDKFSKANILKIGFIHETFANCEKNELMIKLKYLNTAKLISNTIWHTAENDSDFLKKNLGNTFDLDFTTFGVDVDFFKNYTPINERNGFSFFRGKYKPFTDISQYRERREILDFIKPLNLIDVKEYDPLNFSDTDLVTEYNNYKFCIDLPSVFAGPTTRVFEAISCGCIVLTHEKNFSPREISKLKNRLLTYSSKENLVETLTKLMRENKDEIITLEDNYHLNEEISIEAKLKKLLSKWDAM